MVILYLRDHAACPVKDLVTTFMLSGERASSYGMSNSQEGENVIKERQISKRRIILWNPVIRIQKAWEFLVM